MLTLQANRRVNPLLYCRKTYSYIMLTLQANRRVHTLRSTRQMQLDGRKSRTRKTAASSCGWLAASSYAACLWPGVLIRFGRFSRFPVALPTFAPFFSELSMFVKGLLLSSFQLLQRSKPNVLAKSSASIKLRPRPPKFCKILRNY